jgi:hypothetical protein
MYSSAFSLNGDWDTLGTYPLLTSHALQKMGAGTKEEKLKRISDFYEVFRKYDIPFDSNPKSVLDFYEYYKDSTIKTERFSYLHPTYESRYPMYTVMENISKAKRGRYFYNEEGFWWVVGYISFFLTILLMLYRNVRWKQFLATLAAGFTIFILLIILSEIRLFGHWKDDVFLCFSFLTLFFISSILTVRYIVSGKRFSAFISVVMQLLFLSSPFLFVILTVWLDESFDIFGREYYSYLIDKFRLYPDTQLYLDTIKEHSRLNQLHDTAIRWSLIGGCIFHILVLQVFFKERFVKMYSLPGNK